MTLLTAQLDESHRLRTSDSQGREERRREGHRRREIATLAQQQKIREINSGFYAFDAKPLFQHIDKLEHRQSSRRVLSDRHGRDLGKAKAAWWLRSKPSDPHEVLGGNTRAELVDIDARMRAGKVPPADAEGVTILYPANLCD